MLLLDINHGIAEFEIGAKTVAVLVAIGGIYLVWQGIQHLRIHDDVEQRCKYESEVMGYLCVLFGVICDGLAIYPFLNVQSVLRLFPQ